MEPPPPPAGAKAYRLLLALILPILLVGFVSAIAFLNNIGNQEAQFAQAAKTQKDSEACLNEKKRARSNENLNDRLIGKGDATVGPGPHPETISDTKRGKEIDNCVAAVLKDYPPVRNDDGTINFFDLDNYRCVGRTARVYQTKEMSGVSSRSVPNAKNPAGVCSVYYCKADKGCVVSKSTPFNMQRLEQLLSSPTSEDQRLEEAGEIARYPLRPGEYPDFLADDPSPTREDSTIQDKYESFKRLQDLWYDIREPSELSALPESGTKITSLSENLQDTRRLGFPGLQMETLNASAYERIQNIGSGITGFGNTYIPPALNGVSGSQWQQIVFVSNLSNRIF